MYEISVEGFLLHGLLPNNVVSVIGVCWTLGVIFLFYLLFPAFSVVMKSKKRAWLALGVSLWVDYVCEQHFFTEYYVTISFVPRQSFIYCLPLFIVGGLIYLYRNEIRDVCSKYRYIALAVCLVLTILWYVIPNNGVQLVFYVKSLIVYGFWLVYAVGVDSRLLTSKPMKFLSGISMEMYLAQMVIFRVVEKAHLLYVFGKDGIGGWLSLSVTCVLTLIGLLVFIQCFKRTEKLVSMLICRFFS